MPQNKIGYLAGVGALLAASAYFGHKCMNMHSESAAVLKELDYSFMSYVSTYSKSYGTMEEFEFRQSVYAEKDQFINEWNSNKGHSHKLAHNKFSDQTKDEMKRLNGFLGERENTRPD